MAATGASAQGANPPGLLSQYTLMTAFMLLGLAASFLLSQYSSTSTGEAGASLVGEGRAGAEPSFSCAEFERNASSPLAPYMGSKARYQFQYPVVDQTVVQDCEAVQLYAIYRHGTRYPTSKYLAKWRALQSELRSKFKGTTSNALTPLVRGLLNWTNPFSASLGSELADYGMREQFCLAQRLKARFPKLFPPKYSEQVFSFRSTQVSRSLESAMSFASGLFNGTGPLNGYQPFYLESVSEEDDMLLRFFDQKCPLYDKQVSSNETLWRMVESFLSSRPMLDGVNQVQQVLDPGSKHWRLNSTAVTLMYSLCIHEVSLYGTSIWCSLFDNSTLSVLQYNQDLKTFWKKGGGMDITWQRSIPLLSAILSSFNTTASSSSSPRPSVPLPLPLPRRVLLRFAHAETLLPLTAFLGQFQDKQPLTATNYNEMKQRSFVTSAMVPYSSNMAFALYHCPPHKHSHTQQDHKYTSGKDFRYNHPSQQHQGEEDEEEEEEEGEEEEGLYKVMVLVNEQPLPAPRLCGAGEVLCSLRDFTEAVREVMRGGESFQQLCTLGA